ncbi:hypothetical protein Tco_0290176 [Tanacetum coccineum]
MPSHIKTYDESEDPEDHLKIIHAATKVEHWAMPAWCHMFNYILIGSSKVWFDDLPLEADPNHQGREIQKEKRCLKVAQILKSVTKVPAQEEHNLFLRNIITKKHPQAGQNIEDDEETDPFTPRIRYFNLPKRPLMPSHVKTYDESEDPEDHLKIIQVEAKVECWAMPTWCHMFNSILTGSARKNCIKDPVEIHHIKQREGESTEEFVRRFKIESRDMKGAPEVMRISGFMHRITNPELIKLLHDKIPRSVDEMMRVTMSFLGGMGHNTDEYMHLKRQIEELLKNGKLLHVIKELKKNNRKDPPRTNNKGETSNKDKAMEILMHVDGKSGHGNTISNFVLTDSMPDIKSAWFWATALIGFSGEIIWPLGQISLLVKIGDEEHSTLAWMNFAIVRSSSPNNGIIRRLGVRKIQAVPSTAHRMLKFPVAGGIVTVKSSKIIPIECAAVSGPEGQPPAINQTIKERIKVAINPEYPEQTIMIGSTLMEEGQNKLCNLLRRNLDVFAWTPTDMTGVPRHIAEHRLNVREGCPLVRQKKRGQEADRNQAIQEEVEKLVDARIMKEVHYYNFKDLNKACSKDGYPLPEIDWKVESLCRFPFKCFLDAYNGYDQLKLAKEDEEKIVFITSQGTFCYSKMPFGLRNAGATNQRLVDKACGNLPHQAERRRVYRGICAQVQD